MQTGHSLSGMMKVGEHGIDMLGSTARGEMAVLVRGKTLGVDATSKGAEKAHDLVCRINAFHNESNSPKRLTMAWMLPGGEQCGRVSTVV